MFGHYLPIWSVVLVELCFAYLCEMLIGQPFSFKMACKNYDIKKTDPVTFETAVICSTVAIMVPVMSFIAAWLYYPYYIGFNIFTPRRPLDLALVNVILSKELVCVRNGFEQVAVERVEALSPAGREPDAVASNLVDSD